MQEILRLFYSFETFLGKSSLQKGVPPAKSICDKGNTSITLLRGREKVLRENAILLSFFYIYGLQLLHTFIYIKLTFALALVSIYTKYCTSFATNLFSFLFFRDFQSQLCKCCKYVAFDSIQFCCAVLPNIIVHSEICQHWCWQMIEELLKRIEIFNTSSANC